MPEVRRVVDLVVDLDLDLVVALDGDLNVNGDAYPLDAQIILVSIATTLSSRPIPCS